ncbi:DUF4326 domain-containing protein [Kitasatospora sp. NPDC057223]|uniref:DUF4326 domain-containing protein n=1 Tax=Kitasatospora sp. NPDC057223 TaxID=3346055 RepID=UPI003638B835
MTLTPSRIQRRRTAGWRKPENGVYVGRGTRWGNPSRIVFDPTTAGWHLHHDNGGNIGVWPTATAARGAAVTMYRWHLEVHPDLAEAARRELAGRDLMCWCPLDAACHADVLLALAAQTVEG